VFDRHYPILIVPRHIGMASIKKNSISLWLCNCFLSVTSVCRHKDENCVLLGYYAVSSDNFLLMFQDNLSVPSPEVKNTKDKMGPTSCPETSLQSYHYLLHNDPEQCSLQLFLQSQFAPHQEHKLSES
jgi:hypothetical protein